MVLVYRCPDVSGVLARQGDRFSDVGLDRSKWRRDCWTEQVETHPKPTHRETCLFSPQRGGRHVPPGWECRYSTAGKVVEGVRQLPARMGCVYSTAVPKTAKKLISQEGQKHLPQSLAAVSIISDFLSLRFFW